MAFARENLSSQLDGVTKQFTVLQPYYTASLMVIINGLFLTPVVDFTTATASFQLTGNVNAPESGESMIVMYEPTPSSGTTGSGGASPGDYRVIGLPGGAQIRIFY